MVFNVKSLDIFKPFLCGLGQKRRHHKCGQSYFEIDLGQGVHFDFSVFLISISHTCAKICEAPNRFAVRAILDPIHRLGAIWTRKLRIRH